MARFDSLRIVATRLIAKNGRDVQVIKRSESAPADANRPWEPTDADPDPITVKCVLIPFSIKEVDGSTVLARDKLAYISAQDIGDIEISPKDVIIDGNRQYRLIEVEDISPGEQKILYVCQARG